MSRLINSLDEEGMTVDKDYTLKLVGSVLQITPRIAGQQTVIRRVLGRLIEVGSYPGEGINATMMILGPAYAFRIPHPPGATP